MKKILRNQTLPCGMHGFLSSPHSPDFESKEKGEHAASACDEGPHWNHKWWTFYGKAKILNKFLPGTKTLSNGPIKIWRSSFQFRLKESVCRDSNRKNRFLIYYANAMRTFVLKVFEMKIKCNDTQSEADTKWKQSEAICKNEAS